MPSKVHPSARKSKQWLLEALLTLMENKPFSEITITEIAALSGLSRRTFYRHFNSKEEVLHACIKEKMKLYLSYGKRETDFSLENITKLFFTFWKDHLSFAQVLRKNHMLFLLLVEFNRYLPYLHEKAQGKEANYGGEEELSYALAFGAGGFFSALSKWLDDGAKKSAEEMAQITRTILSSYTLLSD